MERTILCIDLKSFYATCECIKRGLDPFTTKLAVVGMLEQKGSIVLAASPGLKKIYNKNVSRVYELPDDPDLLKVQANMGYYVQMAKRVMHLYLEFVSSEDLHVYSVDEAFLDVTSYLHYYQKNAKQLAQTIMERIHEDTGLYATCGIGPNLLLAKVALDIESKKAADSIAWWNKEDVETKLWAIKPLSKMWGIGINMERRLNALHIESVKDLANYPKEVLVQKFGVMGAQLHEHAHGIDESRIQEQYESQSKGLSCGQMLMRDYDGVEIKTILREQVEELVMRLRKQHALSACVHLGIVYTNDQGGFSHQMRLPSPTNSGKEIYDACLALFELFYDGSLIRRVHIALSKLSGDEVFQLSLFEARVQEETIGKTMDAIRFKYGKNTVCRAISLLPHATGLRRSQLIGGHSQ
ncbi:MAG: DNA polymerase thumb domain-containing protein [Erysipelotrichaceae bacterium]